MGELCECQSLEEEKIYDILERVNVWGGTPQREMNHLKCDWMERSLRRGKAVVLRPTILACSDM